MSPRVTGGQHEDSERDVGAYVLGVLEPGELENFRGHLTTCAACRDEVAALQSVVDVLPDAAPQLAAPDALRRRVLAEVRATRRAGAGAAARSRPGLRRPLPRGVLAGALALAVGAAIAVGVLLGRQGSEAGRSLSAHVTYPSASAVLHVQGGRGQLIVRGMPAAPPGKIYEVWLERSAQAPPAPTSALFGVTSTGAATVAVPGNLRGVRAVLVTPEPLGGSLSPTHTPVIIAPTA
jgi:anti-sigma-K factor RskA